MDEKEMLKKMTSAKYSDSLLSKIENKDKKGQNNWMARAKKGEIMRIM